MFATGISNAQDARWITADSPAKDDPNTWVEFRKEFALDRKLKEADVRISADSKYWMWVNDELVVFEGGLKRGPEPGATYYDVVDIAPYLEKGVNDVRILLQYFGKNGFSHVDSGRSGLILDSEDIDLFSDKSWESRRLSEYQSAVKPKPNYRLSESNIRYDARIENQDEWKPSVEMGEWGAEPWGKLVQRPIPLWKDYGVKTAGYEMYSDGKKVHVTVRLPYNMQFTPVLDVTAEEGVCITMQTNHLKGGGEYTVYGEYVTKNGRQQYESLGWLNGEELYFIYPANADVTIHSVGYRETGYDCEFAGSFTSSDLLINKFWEKAMRTLYVNMRDTYFDCPDRERAQWWGDVTILMGQNFYQLSREADALTYKAIHELVNWQRNGEVLFSPIPSTAWGNELPAQMLASISTYGFWYYYLHTADAQTMADAYPAIKRYLGLWKLDEDGLTEYRSGDWSWGDWGSNIDIRLILASWHYLALQSACNIAELVGEDDDVAGYKAIMDSIRNAYNKCWNGYAYRHPSYHGETDDRVNAMAIIAGFADESKYDALFKFFKKQEHASPYMEKYVLEALVKSGHADYALNRFKKRFASMINDPVYTTLFEGWEKGGYGGGSTNHAWSGGMLTVIAENICGVRPTVPGWSEFEICPIPAIKECDITIPSVKGNIRSAFNDTENAFIMNVTIPEGTVARVKLPSSDYRNVTVNGKTYSGDWKFKPGTYEINCMK